jgi:hypothetical protein
MPTKKPKVKCSYCRKKSFYLYHKNKEREIDWAVCIDCFKGFFDKVLGKPKPGGRIDKSPAPAVRCSYCGEVKQDEEKHDMGFETEDWAVCSKCCKKAFDKVMET